MLPDSAEWLISAERIHSGTQKTSEIAEFCGGVEFRQNGEMEGKRKISPVGVCLCRMRGRVSDDMKDVFGCLRFFPAGISGGGNFRGLNPAAPLGF